MPSAFWIALDNTACVFHVDVQLFSSLSGSCFLLKMVEFGWNRAGLPSFPVSHHDVVWWWRCSPTSLIEEEIGLKILWTHADDISSCYLPVWQAQLWAPSPWFWFRCSSFAVGGLASEGLRLPSLKSDVHSTCWFFKQLCPLKKEEEEEKKRTSRSLSVCRGIGGRERGWGGLWSPSYQTLFLCLSLSLTPSLLISVDAHLFFLNSFIIQLTEPRLNDLSDFAWHVVEREPDQNDLKTSATSQL